jgi:hypothetical protein
VSDEYAQQGEVMVECDLWAARAYAARDIADAIRKGEPVTGWRGIPAR